MAIEAALDNASAWWLHIGDGGIPAAGGEAAVWDEFIDEPNDEDVSPWCHGSPR